MNWYCNDCGAPVEARGTQACQCTCDWSWSMPPNDQPTDPMTTIYELDATGEHLEHLPDPQRAHEDGDEVVGPDGALYTVSQVSLEEEGEYQRVALIPR